MTNRRQMIPKRLSLMFCVEMVEYADVSIVFVDLKDQI